MKTENLRFVLVNPTHAGNVGGAARAIKNMGLESLYLVEPKNFPSEVAQRRAAGAEDLLDQARVCSSLDQALESCTLVVGTTSRDRSVDWPSLSPEQAAARLAEGSEQGAVAVLFGQERAGLTNAELDRCHYTVSIPSNPAYPSVNLAGAVLILAYEVRRATQMGLGLNSVETTPPAGADEMRRLYQHLEQVLDRIDFLKVKPPTVLMRKLMRLFNRAAPSREEINILRGILTAIEDASRRET